MSKAATWASELEAQASKLGDRPFLYVVYQDRYISFREMDDNANRLANYLLSLGAKPGNGIALLMNNSPQFLDVFFGMQQIGMYANTVNTGLKGDGLAFIIDNSDTSYLVVDHDLVDLYLSVEKKTPRIEKVIVNTLEAPAGYTVPPGMLDLRAAYGPDVSAAKPTVEFDEGNIILLMYTSGTTGLPKGVVSRYNNNMVDRIRPLALFTVKPETVYYTALPLFHGNALFITTTDSLIAGCTMALSKKFSASRFWDEVWRSKATTFNTIGAIIPILIKQPLNPHERDHCVERILSAGCPADMWEDFETRFNIKIWEGYAAIDGSGLIMNFGDGPKGSIGKPVNSQIRLVNDRGEDVATGEPGELLFYVAKDCTDKVEYYKNPEAMEKKTKGQWEYTGDLMYQDKDGYLFFVGRAADSMMRRRGENVSAYDVEQAIMKHPAVLECAVYGVPSELTEDDIMASIRLVEGKMLTPRELLDFLRDKLARFAIPRYLRIVDDFPRTETFRVKKNELKAAGVTVDTFDAEK